MCNLLRGGQGWLDLPVRRGTLFKGNCRWVVRMKEHRARAPARAVPGRGTDAVQMAELHCILKTACQKLFSVTSSVFLRFAGTWELVAGAGRAEQDAWRHVV